MEARHKALLFFIKREQQRPTAVPDNIHDVLGNDPRRKVPAPPLKGSMSDDF